jgi:hypothetical protein
MAGLPALAEVPAIGPSPPPGVCCCGSPVGESGDEQPAAVSKATSFQCLEKDPATGPRSLCSIEMVLTLEMAAKRRNFSTQFDARYEK